VYRKGEIVTRDIIQDGWCQVKLPELLEHDRRKSETTMCQDEAKTVAEGKVACCCSSNTRNRSCFGRARIKPYDGQLSPLPPTPTHSQTSISFNLQVRRRLAFRLHLPSLHYPSFITRIYRATTLSPNLLEEDRAHSSLAFQSLH
jgi:hypothetical protein